jgi:hypothetical protein
MIWSAADKKTRRQAWEEILRTGQHSKGAVAHWPPAKN